MSVVPVEPKYREQDMVQLSIFGNPLVVFFGTLVLWGAAAVILTAWTCLNCLTSSVVFPVAAVLFLAWFFN